MIKEISVISWNVRGLGRHKKCTDVKATISSTACSVLCLQESKLQDISHFKAISFLPPSLRTFHSIPASGTAGGIITAWDDNLLSCSKVVDGPFTLTCWFDSRADDLSFAVTNVYGPCDYALKPLFLQSLVDLKPDISCPWTIIGDFNITLRPSDKSTPHFNMLEANLFSSTINTLQLQDLPLLDRRYTWSNQQEVPILVRLDRALANVPWATNFPDTSLSSITRTTSDHVPIRLSAKTTIPKSTIFRLDRSLLNIPLFKEKVVTNWESVGPRHAHLGAAGILSLKLKRTRNMAKQWMSSRRSPKTLALNCPATINFLDKLEEARPLSQLESNLRIAVKLSLHRHNAAIAAYWRQRAKIKDCVLGDENSAYLHICASARHRKNQIKSLNHNGITYSAHSNKEAVLLHFFKNLVGVSTPVSTSFDLESLLLPNSLNTAQASDLSKPFTIEEIKDALWAMKDDASPGPDGFGPTFFKSNWNLVKTDLLNLLNDFHAGTADLQRINTAHIVLLPKKSDASTPENYRPVSLQNCSVKLTSKCLSIRAQPLINQLIHYEQTGFIRGAGLRRTLFMLQTSSKPVSSDDCRQSSSS